MALDIYLINTQPESRKSHELYHNSSKHEDLEEIVKKIKAPEKSLGEQGYKALKRIKNVFKRYVMGPLNRYKKRKLARLLTNNLKAFKASSLVANVNVHYSPELSAKQARKIYRKLARKEIAKNGLSMAINTILIALCYVPPLTAVQGTSIPFVLIGYHSAKNIRSILKGRKGANYVPDSHIPVLEDVLHKDAPIGNLNNADLREFYDKHCLEAAVEEEIIQDINEDFEAEMPSRLVYARY